MTLSFPLEVRRDGRALGTVPNQYPNAVSGVLYGPFRPTDAFDEVWPIVSAAIKASKELQESEPRPRYDDLQELPADQRAAAIRDRLRANPFAMKVAETHRAVGALGLELCDRDGVTVATTSVTIGQLGPDVDDDFRAELASDGEFDPELHYPPLLLVALLA